MGKRSNRFFRGITGYMAAMVLLSVYPVLLDASRDDWQQPARVLDAIGVKPGMVIGEPGAGWGYFTLKLAKKVGPTGKVYANDISDYALGKLKEKLKDEGIKNVQVIKGTTVDPLFPVGKMDMVFMSYVIHDMTRPLEFMKNLKPALKPGATVVLLEQDPDKHADAAGHFFKKKKILRIMKKAGYTLDRIEDFLERDTIYIYVGGAHTL